MHDQHLFDLLVDDELAEQPRGELLAGLDHTPDGWRRCALAFLEAQSWQREMGAVVRERADDRSADQQRLAMAPRRAQRGSKVRAVSMPLAMAASLLVAFALGLAVRPTTNDSTSGGASNGLGSSSAVQLAVQSPEDDGALEPDDRALPNDGTGRWGTVKLAIDYGLDGTPHEEVELPAVECDSLDESLFTSPPAAIGPELQQVFERLGHQVRQERELVSFELNDGRQMVVPVDRVRFTPVGNRAYQ